MDLAFSDEDLKFRDEVRAFIEENLDEEIRAAMEKTRNGYISKDLHVRWQKALAKKGWLAPNWPQEYGGPGFTVTQRFIFEAEMAAYDTPHVIPFGPRMCAPVIMKFGTEEQKQRFLPDMLETNVLWCQGYSEPGSGSDLASVQTRAEDQGDHYLVNGSKIWTSVAQYADWIFCLVRTKKTEKPQEGISFILIDMTSEGVTVDPIITIDNPEVGMQEVNQVFFENVKVPKENRIGEENKGWTYAKYLLEFERGNAYSPGLKRAMKNIYKMAEKEGLNDDPSFSRRVAKTEVDIRAMEMNELRILSQLASGQNPGAVSSMLKLRGSELQQQVTELALEAAGTYALPFTPLKPGSNEEPIGPGYEGVMPRYGNFRKTSIYAGSNEIQHNIMAKLILGL
jgi:alkylation response protein AidB-like acyl-CoA dehydrogenase